VVVAVVATREEAATVEVEVATVEVATKEEVAINAFLPSVVGSCFFAGCA
jgi:hypothetical protein